MRIGVLYAGKTGTTESCALELCKLLDASPVNLVTEKANLEDYDILILGSSVRMGKIHPEMKRFLKLNKAFIQQKAYAIFICQGLPETYDKVITNNFSENFRNNTIVVKSFGGDLALEKQKGLAKLMTKVLMKNPNFVKPKIDHQAIFDFSKTIKKYINEGR